MIRKILVLLIQTAFALEETAIVKYNNNELILESFFNAEFSFRVRKDTKKITYQGKTAFLPKFTGNIREIKTFICNSGTLTKLADDQFDDLCHLEDICLSENQIKNINAATFSKLQRLTTLNLSENQIESIDPALFNELINIEILKISNNLLKSIPVSIRSLKHLRLIDISGNDISNTSDDNSVGKIEILLMFGEKAAMDKIEIDFKNKEDDSFSWNEEIFKSIDYGYKVDDVEHEVFTLSNSPYCKIEKTDANYNEKILEFFADYAKYRIA